MPEPFNQRAHDIKLGPIVIEQCNHPLGKRLTCYLFAQLDDRVADALEDGLRWRQKHSRLTLAPPPNCQRGRCVGVPRVRAIECGARDAQSCSFFSLSAIVMSADRRGAADGADNNSSCPVP